MELILSTSGWERGYGRWLGWARVRNLGWRQRLGRGGYFLLQAEILVLGRSGSLGVGREISGVPRHRHQCWPLGEGGATGLTAGGGTGSVLDKSVAGGGGGPECRTGGEGGGWVVVTSWERGATPSLMALAAQDSCCGVMSGGILQ